MLNTFWPEARQAQGHAGVLCSVVPSTLGTTAGPLSAPQRIGSAPGRVITSRQTERHASTLAFCRSAPGSQARHSWRELHASSLFHTRPPRPGAMPLGESEYSTASIMPTLPFACHPCPQSSACFTPLPPDVHEARVSSTNSSFREEAPKLFIEDHQSFFLFLQRISNALHQTANSPYQGTGVDFGASSQEDRARMAKAAANALYDPQFGWNPPARYQQERAWCEVVQKEKKIQAVQEKENRERERRSAPRGCKWPGGPHCGTAGFVEQRAPFFSDGDIWRGELLKRQVGVASCSAPAPTHERRFVASPTPCSA